MKKKVLDFKKCKKKKNVLASTNSLSVLRDQFVVYDSHVDISDFVY